MQAELIAIGDEILIGQTIDTNSTFIATHLNMNGISVKQKRVIADDADAIKDALDAILPETKLVFMTGGLGPTNDDITKYTLNEYFGGELVFHSEVFDHIKKLFASFNREPSESNRSQAFLPSSCVPLTNKMGTAPGMRFEKDGRFYFSLPGVPYETRNIVEHEILPWIRQNLQRGTVVHKTIMTQGVPESELAEKLREWENALPPQVSLAYLPSPGIVRLRLTCYVGTEESARRMVEQEEAKAIQILGDIVFGEDAQTLEEVIGISLKKRNVTVSTAESCTGGYIAHLITSVAGSSDYFLGSVVSYAIRAKEELLGVDPEVIEKKGVVSQEVAEQMAAGARKKFHSDFAIATTGVAGPAGGSEETPVGTVWIAIAGPERMRSKCFHFGRNRERNIQKAALMGLDMLRREVQNFKGIIVE